MRVSDTMMTGSVKSQLSRVSARLTRLQTEMSSGLRLLRPSDDPVGMLRAASLRTGITQIDQYKKTVDYAKAWLKSEDSALGDMQNLLREIRTIGLSGANPRSEQERETYARQIEEYANAVMQSANSNDGLRFLFAGHQTLTAPFTGTPPAAIVYSGDAGERQIEIVEGMSLTLNHSGAEVFNMGGAANAALPDVFQSLATLSAQVRAGDSAGIDTTLTELDAHLTRFTAIRAETGTRLQQVELAQERLTHSRLILDDLLGETESADLAETLIHLREQENVFQASSYVASSLTRGGLLEWLR